jgi:hypothetical protein
MGQQQKASTAIWYFASADGSKNGPVSASQLQQLAADGQVRHDTLIWKEGLAEWVPASRVNGLKVKEPDLHVMPEMPPIPNQGSRPQAGNATKHRPGSGFSVGVAILSAVGIFFATIVVAAIASWFDPALILLVPIVMIIGTAIWASIDAGKIEIDRYDVRGPFPTSSTVTLIGCLLLWILVFPMYLIIKGKIARGEVSPKRPT